MKNMLFLYALLAAPIMIPPAFGQDQAAPIAGNATAGKAPTTPVITDDGKLLADFGGKEGLTRIMDDFMVRLVANPRTRDFFAPADQDKIKRLLVEQMCVIMHGPCEYTGRSMAEAHAGMGVKEGGFYALVEEFQRSMSKFKVPFQSQNRLLSALAPMHRDMINK